MSFSTFVPLGSKIEADRDHEHQLLYPPDISPRSKQEAWSPQNRPARAEAVVDWNAVINDQVPVSAPCSSQAEQHDLDSEKQERFQRPGQPATKSKGSRALSVSLSVWLWESLSVLLSLVCTAANIAVLRVLDGEAYNSWHILDVDLTPNALISIISTIGKVSLLVPVAECISQLKWTYFHRRAQRLSRLQDFDDASRGPWGCVKFLWKLKHRGGIALFGAAITILALVVDPFTQQILAYPTSLVPAGNETARISIAKSYDNSYYVQAGTDQASLLPYIAQFDNALLRGIVSSDLQPTYTCSTGDCKWPKYSTLAISSECSDVTADTTISSRPSNDTFFSSGPVYSFHAPNNVTVTNGLWSPTATLTMGSSPYDVLISVAKIFQPGPYNGIGIYMGREGQIANITTFVFSPPSVNDAFNQGHNPPPVVTQCTLKWRVNVHADSKYANGVLQDAPSTVADLIVRTDQCNLTAFDRPRKQPTVLCPAYSSLNHAPSFESLNASAIPLSSDVFWLNSGLVLRLQETIVSDFTVNVNDSDTPSSTLGRSYYQANNHNISQTWHAIAKSMTVAVRDGPNKTTVTGQALQPIVQVEVRWGWFVYSATLTLLAATLMAVVILSSSVDPGTCWKSSSLALLFHGLGPDPATNIQTGDVDEMYSAASSIHMQLKADGKGWIAFQRA